VNVNNLLHYRRNYRMFNMSCNRMLKYRIIINYMLYIIYKIILYIICIKITIIIFIIIM
jgi:hypothetical protein